MDYCAGGELYRYIRKHEHGLSEAESHRFFTQIVSAVRYCHARNIVHRDIKHKNILLKADGSACLADFGLSSFMIEGECKSFW